MTDDLKTQFEAATIDAKSLAKRPDNDAMLELYALYKQASSGDVSGSRPSGFDFVGGAKYDAWEKLKGVTNDDAMKRYIAKVESLKS